MTNRNVRLIAFAALMSIIPFLLAACTGGGSSPAQVRELVRGELANQPAPPPPGPSRAEIRETIRSSMANAPRTHSHPGLDRSEMERIVEAALAELSEPQPSLTREEVEQVVRDAIAALPESGPTREEIVRVAESVVARIPPRSAPADYTRFLVQNAVSRYESDGLAATLAHYSRPESVDGQWYVFIVDGNGRVLAHPDGSLVGLDLKGPLGTDANGYSFGPEMLSAGEEGRWVSYVYGNPETRPIGTAFGELQLKNAWVVRRDGLLFGSGWYVDADEFTQSFVAAAVGKFREAGLEGTVEYFTGPESEFAGLAAAIDYYNSIETVGGKWSAFIADGSGRIVDHHDKDLVGRHLEDLFGEDPFGVAGFEASAEGNWVTTESLRIWVVQHDGLVFGSGWRRDEPALPVESAGDDGTLTLVYWQAPTIPNPYLSGGFKDRDAGAITLEPLANHNPDGVLVPALAAEIPTRQNGGIPADLASITWKLRSNLRWSDGSPLTAADVAFTWRYCTEEATGCTASRAFTGVTSVEALDELTVRVAFHAPTPYPYTAFVGAGSPVLSRAQFADCVGAAAAGCEEENHAPLGSGPYRLVRFVPGRQAVYERNPHHHGAVPHFDRVVLEGGGDARSAARAVLESGQADYAWNLQIDPETLAGMEAEGRGKVVSAFSSLVERIVLNQTNPDPSLGAARSEYLEGANPHPFLTFPPVARAMSMALDRGLISERLYGFAGEPACNLIDGPPVYVSTSNDGCITQDIEGAGELLDENGIVDTDGDGTREYNGVPLRVTFQTSTNDIRQETQSLVAGWWREIGIETELAHHDAAVFFGGDPVSDREQFYRRFLADVQMFASGPDIDPQQYFSGLTCVQVPDRDNNWGGRNVARACSPEFDELVEELSHTPIGAGRAALVQRMNDILVRSHYEIPLVNRGIVSAHVQSLRGVRINGWDSELWNIGEWSR